jgi:hypothetical protein
MTATGKRRGGVTAEQTNELAPLLHWPHEKTDREKSHARDRSCFAQYRNNGFAAHRR